MLLTFTLNLLETKIKIINMMYKELRDQTVPIS